MPILNGEEILNVTANQLDELLFNINFGSVNYKSLIHITMSLFSSQSVAKSTTVKNQTGIFTGNNVKMSVSFSQTGPSTNCTMKLYGSDYADLSIPRYLAILNLGSGQTAGVAIDTIAIPAYSFAELTNNDPNNTAIGTVEITTWQELGTL